jgi:hypothetical protein
MRHAHPDRLARQHNAVSLAGLLVKKKKEQKEEERWFNFLVLPSQQLLSSTLGHIQEKQGVIVEGFHGQQELCVGRSQGPSGRRLRRCRSGVPMLFHVQFRAVTHPYPCRLELSNDHGRQVGPSAVYAALDENETCFRVWTGSRPFHEFIRL